MTTICAFGNQAPAQEIARVPEAPPTYTLAEGDQITIHTSVVAEVSEKAYRIESDGCVKAPLVGSVRAAGETVRGLEEILAKKFEQFYFEPQLTVSVTDFRSQPVSVIGAVNTPGIHQLRGKQTVVEMLSAAGGARADAGPVLTITRKMKCGAIPLPVAHPDGTGNFSIAEIDLQQLLAAKDPGSNIALCPDDVLSIPKGEIVYVVGQVKKAGGFQLGSRHSITVLEALSLAEGLDPKAAPGHSLILRPSPENGGERQELPVNLKAIMAGKSPDVPLHPNDILLVPNSAARSAAVRSLETALQIGTGLIIWRH